MLTKFSEKAQKALVVAESIAFDLGHASVGSEHLLLSLTKIKDNVFCNLLEEYDVSAQLIEADIIRLFGKKDMQPFYMEYTNIVRMIMDQAIKESRKRHEKKVSIDCLCLGLLDVKDCVAIELLNKYGVDIKMLKNELSGQTKIVNELDQIPELTNLNQRVKSKDIKVIGRDKELQQLIEILCRKEKNNAIVVGKAGVGKTALIEKLAISINEGSVPELLKDSIVYELDLPNVIAGTKYRGEFEEKFKKIIKKICAHPECIIFIDEIHNIVGAGGAEGAIDAANIIKPYIARRDFTCIGATTTQEYYQHFEKDEALNRRFQYVHVEPTSVEETINIIHGLKPSFEKYHGVQFDSKYVDYLVNQANRYFYTKNMPDKAIDLLDLVLVKAKMNHKESINKQDIDELVEKMMNMTRYENRLSHLEKMLKHSIKGQNDAIDQIVHQLQLVEQGLYDLNRPKLVSLFVGSTGVGKTEIGKLIAKYYFDDSKNFIKLDMSEYKEASSVSKIIGAPPGYVGYEQQPLLTMHMTNHPRSVIILDEIEKAHPDVLNLFLQVFDEGVLKNQRGVSIDFKESLIIMTSNAGTSLNQEAIGFQNKGADIKAIEKIFPLEWINRIDLVVHFKKLEKTAAKAIMMMQLDHYNQQLNTAIECDEDECEKLINSADYSKYGARALHRTIKQFMFNQLKQEI